MYVPYPTNEVAASYLRGVEKPLCTCTCTDGSIMAYIAQALGGRGGSARTVAHAHNYFTRELRGKEQKMAEQGELREEPMQIDTTVPNGSEKKGTVDSVSEAASKPAHDLPWYDCSDRY